MTYWDTSALAAIYLPEANTATAIREFHQQTGVILTPLQELELANALQLRLFRHEISPAEAAVVRQAQERDRAAMLFTWAPVPTGVHRRALDLALAHSAQLGTRSLDLLHVAAALELGASGFLTFDRRQRALARAAGLKVLA